MRKKFNAILASLGLADKAKNKQLTADEIKKIDAALQKEHKVSLKEMMAQIAEEENNSQTVNALADILAVDEHNEEENLDEDVEVEDDVNDGSEDPENMEEQVDEEREKEEEGKGAKVIKKVKNLQKSKTKLEKENATLRATKEIDKPIDKAKMNNVNKATLLGRAKHTATHLFGIENPLYAINAKNWWNQMVAAGATTDKKRSSQEASALVDAYLDFGASVKDRYAELHKSNMLALLDFNKMAVGEVGIDYTELEDQLGDYYRVRRTDMIIAYLRKYKSVTDIFPTLTGVQDQMVMNNAFLGQFSQSYQAGRQFKGNIKLAPEIARVDDVMFKHLFSNLKDLEKQYIGYLNREGSQPIKWTFLEWIFVELAVQIQNEYNIRAIMGYRIEPVDGQNAHFLFASDGIIHKLETYEDDFKILPFNLGTYDKSTIVEYVEGIMEQVNRLIPTIEDIRLYINEKHIPWYKAGFREKYGADGDFTGSKTTAIDYSAENFIAVPNMPWNCYKMFLTYEGNFETYTLEAGEMHRTYFERELESLIAAAWWKEGTGAQMTGKKFKTMAELAASNHYFQYIFSNEGSTPLADGATTLDGNLNMFFKSVANTAATAITTITNAVPGMVYRITVGSAANAPTISKAGDFSEITEDWTPTAVGDYIRVTQQLQQDASGNLIPTGKFIEVDRRVSVAVVSAPESEEEDPEA